MEEVVFQTGKGTNKSPEYTDYSPNHCVAPVPEKISEETQIKRFPNIGTINSLHCCVPPDLGVNLYSPHMLHLFNSCVINAC